MKQKESFFSSLYNLDSKRIANKIFKIKKATYQRLFLRPSPFKPLLFIIGCQRSGTTLMQNIFNNDINAKIYGERSILCSDDAKTNIRLNSIKSIKSVIDMDHSKFTVVKPLVETQRINDLLENLPNSKAIFMYRNYKDVALSNINFFSKNNGINNLRPIIEKDTNNWRSEHVPIDTRIIVEKFFSEDMNQYDASALFWFVRNSLFFNLNLEHNPNVMLCRYESLIENPMATINKIYDFIGIKLKDKSIIKDVHSSALGKGKNVSLSNEIDAICHNLMNRLNNVFETRQTTCF